jgi:hypothetical protein
MATPASTKQNTIVIFLMAAVLGWGAFSAFTLPAGEYPPPPYHLFTLGLDVLMTVILAVLLMAERRAPPTLVRTVAMGSGALGVLAGIAQIAVRFTSDHGWWTGHYLPPVF